MANIPDNIVAILGVDNAGAITNIDPNLVFNKQIATGSPVVVQTIPTKKENATEPTVITNTIESKVALTITADPTNIPMVNKDQDNLENSVVWQVAKKVGVNTKSPRFLFDVYAGSVNVTPSTLKDGYKLKNFNFAYADFTTSGSEQLYFGDDTSLPVVNVKKLLIRGLTTTTSPTKIRILGINDTGNVSAFSMPTSGSVLFSDGVTLSSAPTNLFWDITNSRLGILTNVPSYPLDLNGTARIATSLITPIIGNTGGVTANNTWTFTSNVVVPVTPTDPTHAASKQYVDNSALTGLRLGASVKTVATSNIGLSGLAAINGYTPIAGDRILVIGQTTQSANGVYDAASGAWTRSTDSDTDAELRGYQYLVTAGTNANYRYGNTNQSAITVGSTAITYQQISSAETDPIFTASAAFGITATNITNWNTAYNRSLTTLTITGTTTKTVTLTKQDATTLTATFTDTVTSVFGRTGAVTATSGDYTTAQVTESVNLYYTDARVRAAVSFVAGSGGYNAGTGVFSIPTNTNQLTNGAGYITGITYTNVITALGFTPYDGSTNSNGYITASGARSAISLTTSGTSGAATYNSGTGVLNIPQYQGGVTSFNTRTGAVTLTSTDISSALGFTPVAATVTSVAVAAGTNTGLTITGSPITTSGTITIGTISDDVRFRSLRIGTFSSAVPTATDGSIFASGDIVGYSTSDERLKDNIKVIDNATDKLSRIRGVKFDWKKEFEYLHGFEGADMGVIAQDVMEEFPEAITQRESGYLAVRYEKLIGLLVAAVNEQSDKIKELESKIK